MLEIRYLLISTSQTQSLFMNQLDDIFYQSFVSQLQEIKRNLPIREAC